MGRCAALSRRRTLQGCLADNKHPPRRPITLPDRSIVRVLRHVATFKAYTLNPKPQTLNPNP